MRCGTVLLHFFSDLLCVEQITDHKKMFCVLCPIAVLRRIVHTGHCSNDMQNNTDGVRNYSSFFKNFIGYNYTLLQPNRICTKVQLWFLHHLGIGRYFTPASDGLRNLCISVRISTSPTIILFLRSCYNHELFAI